MSMLLCVVCTIICVLAKDNMDLVQRTIRGETLNDASTSNTQTDGDPSEWSTIQNYEITDKCLQLENKQLKYAPCNNRDEQLFQFTSNAQIKSKTGLCARPTNNGIIEFDGCDGNNEQQQFELGDGNTIRNIQTRKCWSNGDVDTPITSQTCSQGQNEQFYFTTRTNGNINPHSVKLNDEWVLLYMQNTAQKNWEWDDTDNTRTITQCPLTAGKCSNLGNLKTLKPDGSIDFHFQLKYTDKTHTSKTCTWFQHNNPMEAEISGFYKQQFCDWNNFQGLRPGKDQQARMVGTESGDFAVGAKTNTIQFESGQSDATSVELYIKRDTKYEWTLLLVQKFSADDSAIWFDHQSAFSEVAECDENAENTKCSNLGNIEQIQGSRNSYHLKLEREGTRNGNSNMETHTLEWMQKGPPTQTKAANSDIHFTQISAFPQLGSGGTPLTGLIKSTNEACLMTSPSTPTESWWQCVGRTDGLEKTKYPGGAPWEGDDGDVMYIAVSTKLWMKSQSDALMACNDIVEGFVDHADRENIEGYIKSCPQDLPYVNKNEVCEGTICRVAPDRERCCRQAQCKCDFGTPAKGEACTQNDALKCEKCDVGYHPDGERCVENICKCEGGTHAIGRKCETHNTVHCVGKCEQGYHKSQDMGPEKCVPNKCTCTHGEEKNTENGYCPVHGTEDCHTCTSGYMKETITNDGKTRDECKPAQCDNKTVLNNYQNKQFKNQCSDAKTGKRCAVSCADGYSGNTKYFFCSTSGKLEAENEDNELKCEANTCNDNDADFGASTTKTCDNQKCEVECAEGYCPKEGTAEKSQWTCTAEGFQGGHILQCEACPCQVTRPINGNWADEANCGSTMVSGGNPCKVICDDGYEETQSAECVNQKFTPAKCEEKTCDASADPQHGEAGGCAGKTKLATGESCTPTCSSPGYKLDKDTTCNRGELVPGKCVPTRRCKLQWNHACGTDYPFKGYWSDEKVTYTQCEQFCNDKYWELQQSKPKVTVSACELAGTREATTDEERKETTGAWCFAHTKQDTTCGPHDQGYLGRKNIAGATCVPELGGGVGGINFVAEPQAQR